MFLLFYVSLAGCLQPKGTISHSPAEAKAMMTLPQADRQERQFKLIGSLSSPRRRRLVCSKNLGLSKAELQGR